MTLQQIAAFVTAKIGQTDSRSVELCKTFVNARYSMVADSFPWRDMEMTFNGELAARAVCNMPDGMDRVIAIRSNGETFLDPCDVNILMQTDPGIFERAGLPEKYREFTENEHKKIQFYPTPNVTVPLFFVGKRTLEELGDNDYSIIRNIDQCLIAYAEGDMWERQKQVGKAQAKFTEAAAMLTAAQNLETGQANKPRQAKQLTVAGNSLAELADQVCAQTGQWSLDSVVLIKNFLRTNYQSIWDACNWSEATVMARVNTDGSEVILPVYFDRVISVRGDTSLPELGAIEPSLLFGICPAIFEQTGTSLGFSYLTSVGVKFLPPVREKLQFVSTSTADKGKMYVMGELNGSEVSESIQLNGTVPINSVNQYDTPLTVAKSITRGSVAVVGQTSGTILETIPADQRECRHIRIWLHPTPSSAYVCLILGKRTMNPFAQDEDTPLLRDIGAALIAGASADMFMKIGNDKAAAGQREQSQAALKTLINLENQQGAYSARVIPSVETYSEYDMADFACSKSYF